MQDDWRRTTYLCASARQNSERKTWTQVQGRGVYVRSAAEMWEILGRAAGSPFEHRRDRRMCDPSAKRPETSRVSRAEVKPPIPTSPNALEPGWKSDGRSFKTGRSQCDLMIIAHASSKRGSEKQDGLCGYSDRLGFHRIRSQKQHPGWARARVGGWLACSYCLRSPTLIPSI